MTTATPKRIVLRVHEQYTQEWVTIVKQFFDFDKSQSTDDYYPHLCPADLSSKMHIVLDLHCKQFPSTDVDQLPYEVFKVKKPNDLYAFP